MAEEHLSWGRGVVERGTWLQPCCEIWELSSLKRHPLILRPILHKSAIAIFGQQHFDSNNFTYFNYTFKYTFPYIHSLP